MSESEIVVVEVVVAAPASGVWRALRDPAELRRWFGWEYDGLEEEIDVIFGSGATASEEDLAVAAEGGDRIGLEPRGERTVVRVTRGAPAAGASWDEVYEEIDAGWLTFLQQLRFALERHPGEARRTLRLTGRRREGDAVPAATALGLAEALSLGAGERYDAVTAVGEPLRGDVWFSAERTTGLTVDAYGDGLLVLGEESARASPPHGRSTALITAYGLDDARFAAVRDRWTGWWESHFDDPGAVAGP
jgi:hypothetical protein